MTLCFNPGTTPSQTSTHFPAAPSTPPRAIRAQQAQGTPSPARKLKDLVLNTTPDRSAIAQEKRDFDQHVRDLGKLPEHVRSPSLSKVLELITDRVGEVAHQQLGKRAGSTLAVPPNLFGDLQVCWPTRLARQLSDLLPDRPQDGGPRPFECVDWHHVTQGKKTKDKFMGLHFCPPGHPLRVNLTDIIVNQATGVWCGRCQDKFSSFFPDRIESEDDLLSLISSENRKPIASEENRGIFLVDSKKPFVIEMYFRGLSHIASAFPIFFFDKLQKGIVYNIAQREYQSDVILRMAKEVVARDGKAVLYKIGSDSIVDIASVIGLPIKSGVYFQIPDADLSS